MFQFCKYFKAIKYIIEETEYLKIDEEEKNTIKLSFINLVTISELNELWITCSNILSIVNDLFPNDFVFIKHIVHTIQPMIESFFIIYNQLQSKAYEK